MMKPNNDGNAFWIHDFLSGFSDGVRVPLFFLVVLCTIQAPLPQITQLLLLIIGSGALITAIGTYITHKKEMQSNANERTVRETEIYKNIDLNGLAEPLKAHSSNDPYVKLTPAGSAFRVFVFYIAGGLLVLTPVLLLSNHTIILTVAIPVTLVWVFVAGWFRGQIYQLSPLTEAFRMSFYTAVGVGLLYLIMTLVSA